VEVGATWRGTPGRLDGPTAPVSLRVIPGPSGSAAPEAVYLRNFKPGVYTFTVRLVAPLAGPLRPTIRFSAMGRGPRASGVSVDASRGPGRILLPRDLWDDDRGPAERSVDTITKFRLPDGITWVERRLTR
jgi:hypothetical protein